MIEVNNIYRCNVCGNITQVLHAGVEDLACCQQPMEKLSEKTSEEGNEKHVPVITKTEQGFEVKVGSVPHPMEEKHYIEWIELIADGQSLRKYLKPGDEPKAIFCVEANAVSAREYCNIHSLWRGE